MFIIVVVVRGGVLVLLFYCVISANSVQCISNIFALTLFFHVPPGLRSITNVQFCLLVHMAGLSHSQILKHFSTPACAAGACFKCTQHFPLKPRHVLPFEAHLRQPRRSALLSAELPLSQCSYSLVITLLACLLACARTEIETLLL